MHVCLNEWMHEWMHEWMNTFIHCIHCVSMHILHILQCFYVSNSNKFVPFPILFWITPWSQLIWHRHETFVLLRTPHVRNYAASRANHITCDQKCINHKWYSDIGVSMYHPFSSCIALRWWTCVKLDGCQVSSMWFSNATVYNNDQ